MPNIHYYLSVLYPSKLNVVEFWTVDRTKVILRYLFTEAVTTGSKAGDRYQWKGKQIVSYKKR